MSFENDKEADRRRKSAEPAVVASTNSRKRKGAPSAEVGSALRSVYERTVSEEIPPDLLDLLGKLG